MIRRHALALLSILTAITGGYIYYQQYQLSLGDQHLSLSESIPTAPIASSTQEPDTSSPSEAITIPTVDPQPRLVTIHNRITKKMITYHKAFMSYTPAFSIEINGTLVANEESIAVTPIDNSVQVTYYYNFLNGYRVGFRTIRVTLPDNQDQFTLTFSWKNEHHIIIDHALDYSVIDKSPA